MECFESSIFLRCLKLKKVRQGYLVIEEEISSVYLGSLIHRLIVKTAELIKIGFKYSIFGRLTEINEGASKNFFQTSKTIKFILNWMRNLRNKLITFSTPSSLASSIRRLKCDFFSRPLKVGGITIITAIMANAVLSTILYKHISLWGWLMRGLLLFIGISGLFCNTDWPTLKINSIFFKKRDVSR